MYIVFDRETNTCISPTFPTREKNNLKICHCLSKIT